MAGDGKEIAALIEEARKLRKSEQLTVDDEHFTSWFMRAQRKVGRIDKDFLKPLRSSFKMGTYVGDADDIEGLTKRAKEGQARDGLTKALGVLDALLAQVAQSDSSDDQAATPPNDVVAANSGGGMLKGWTGGFRWWHLDGEQLWILDSHRVVLQYIDTNLWFANVEVPGEKQVEVYWDMQAEALTCVEDALLNRQVYRKLSDRFRACSRPMLAEHLSQDEIAIIKVVADLAFDRWPVSGRRLRHALDVAPDDPQFLRAMKRLVPRFISMRAHTQDFYSLSLPSITSELVDLRKELIQTLSVIRSCFDKDPEFESYSWADLRASGAGESEFLRYVTAISAASLHDGGSNHSSLRYVWRVPHDVESLYRTTPDFYKTTSGDLMRPGTHSPVFLEDDDAVSLGLASLEVPSRLSLASDPNVPTVSETESSARKFRVSGYTLREEVGNGAGGRVFRATEDSPSAVERAIKVIEPYPFGRGEDPQPRFLSEVEALHRLQHRAIVRYISSGRTDDEYGYLYLVMEYVEGDKLRAAAQSMTFKERVEAIIEVLHGLAHMHESGIFHRDVKGGNIVVNRADGQPVLVDFGLAYLVSQNSNDEDTAEVRTRYSIGTPGYVAPEAQADPRASRTPQYDVFSTGVTLYEILAGRLPNSQAYISLANVDPELAGLDAILEQSIAGLDRRFSTATEMATALQGWLIHKKRQETISNPSTLTARLAQKIQQQQETITRKSAAKLEMQAMMDRQYAPIDELVRATGLAAFEELGVALANHRLEFLDSAALGSFKSKIAPVAELIPICALRYSGHLDQCIMFAHSTDPSNPLGRRGQTKRPFINWPKPRSGNLQKKMHVLCPVWVLYQEGTSQSPSRILYGGVAAVTPTPNPSDEHFALSIVGQARANRAPVDLNTPTKLKDYLINCVAAAMHVDLDG